MLSVLATIIILQKEVALLRQVEALELQLNATQTMQSSEPLCPATSTMDQWDAFAQRWDDGQNPPTNQGRGYWFEENLAAIGCMSADQIQTCGMVPLSTPTNYCINGNPND